MSRAFLKRILVFAAIVFLGWIVNHSVFWYAYQLLFSDLQNIGCVSESEFGSQVLRSECNLGAGAFSLWIILDDLPVPDATVYEFAVRFTLGDFEKKAAGKGVVYNGWVKVNVLSFSRSLLDSLSGNEVLEVELMGVDAVNGFKMKIGIAL